MTHVESQLPLPLDSDAPAEATAAPAALDAEACAEWLREQGYRVLAPVVHRPVIDEPRGEPERHGLVVDVETTGREHGTDAIIQLAAIPFRFTERTGRVTTVDEPVVAYDDPGRPIPPEVVGLTGITDADVAWGCTWNEIDWGPGSQTLEMLLLRHCEKCIDAHRADEDCLAVIELLAADLRGRTAMARLLEATRAESCRVLAVGAPFDVKDELKRRGYRWHPGDAGSPKCWWRELPAEEQAAERAWLESSIYPEGRCRAEFDRITARERYRAFSAG